MLPDTPVKKSIDTPFWIAWGIDALISGIAVYFFMAGVVDGTVSSFNIGIWSILLAALASVQFGSLWLKSAGHKWFAFFLLAIPAVPGILYAVFMIFLIFSGVRWN